MKYDMFIEMNAPAVAQPNAYIRLLTNELRSKWVPYQDIAELRVLKLVSVEIVPHAKYYIRTKSLIYLQ